MSRRRRILDLLDDDDLIVFYEPEYFDEAILGLTSHSPGWPYPPRVCYSSSRVIDILMREMDCEYLDAVEYFEVNIQGLGMSDPPPPLLVHDWAINEAFLCGEL